MDTDFAWFKENYDDLFVKYGESYLVIKDKTVLGSYRDAGTAVRETSKTEPMGSFIVQYCNGDSSGYTNYISSMNFMGAIG